MWTPVCLAVSVSSHHGWLNECLSNCSKNDQLANLLIDFDYLVFRNDNYAWIWRSVRSWAFVNVVASLRTELQFVSSELQNLLCMWMLQVPPKVYISWRSQSLGSQETVNFIAINLWTSNDVVMCRAPVTCTGPFQDTSFSSKSKWKYAPVDDWRRVEVVEVKGHSFVTSALVITLTARPLYPPRQETRYPFNMRLACPFTVWGIESRIIQPVI